MVQEAVKSTLKKIGNYFNAKANKLGYNAILGILVGLAITICVIDINIKANMIYMVKVKDKVVGYVKDNDTYMKTINSINTTDGNSFASLVTSSKTANGAKKLLNNVELERIIRRELNLKMPAVVAYAGGVEIVKVDSKESLDKALQEVKEHYYPKLPNGSYTITSSEIKEEITTSTAIVDPNEILDANEAIEKILSGRGEKKTYTIKEGDTIWDIAIANGISIEEIQDANPSLNIEKLKIGKTINLAVNLPYINVEIVANVKSKESIPYETQKVVDKSMTVGKSKIKKQGKNGITEIEKTIKIVNDDVIEEEVISSKVLTAAVDKIFIVGSKEKEFVASGNFMRPSRGSITSGFGRRWGRLHRGIDLGAPTGTPIYAADGGTVTLAGWYSSYGKCIIINHGNGYQTLYGHASKLYVRPGQKVSKGQKIAAVGSTGRSTGPHVHFEVRRNGVPQNPLKYIR